MTTPTRLTATKLYRIIQTTRFIRRDTGELEVSEKIAAESVSEGYIRTQFKREKKHARDISEFTVESMLRNGHPIHGVPCEVRLEVTDLDWRDTE